MRKSKEVHFSEARQNLSAIVDEVAKTGRPVTILRHGKPAVVIASTAEYPDKVRNKRNWLKGSIKIKDGVDLEKALAELSKQHIELAQESLDRSARELSRSER